jgi:glycosyltransferase involved in cell wall biosynthesis
MIHYYCPDVTLASSGMRLLYKHVAILNRHAQRSAMLHDNPPFRLADVPEVPIGYLSVPNTLAAGDIVVVPEAWTRMLATFAPLPLKLVVIALNWKYIYASPGSLRDGDWRDFGVRHVLVNSPFIGEMVQWAMQIPWHLTTMGVDPALYRYVPGEKVPQVSFIARKAPAARELRQLLGSRKRAYVEAIAWKALEGLSQAEYAREICRSQLFLNLSHAEGFPFSLIEAMRAGTLVAGYNSVGGQRELLGDGPRQNCIQSENLDYVTLARRIEGLLDDMLRGDLGRWASVIQNGIKVSGAFTLEEEDRTAWTAWQEILAAI